MSSTKSPWREPHKSVLVAEVLIQFCSTWIHWTLRRLESFHNSSNSVRELRYHTAVTGDWGKISWLFSHLNYMSCTNSLTNTKPWEQLMKLSLLGKGSDQHFPRCFLCVDSSGCSKWWAQTAALPSVQDWHCHSSLCRCVSSGTSDHLGSKRLRGSKDTGEQTIKVERKPCFFGEQAKKIK